MTTKGSPDQGRHVAECFIVAAKRTPIGRFQGVLSGLSAPSLGAAAIQGALQAGGIEPSWVGSVYMGQVLTAGAGQAPARQAALGAKLPVGVRCTTVGKVCGSGMQSVLFARNEIALGQEDVVVAGGQESMSQAPFVLMGARAGFRMGHQELIDSMIRDGLWDPYGDKHMGSCAEDCVRHYKFSRQEQDEFAKQSYLRVSRAYETKAFDQELVSVQAAKGRELVQVSEDEEFRAVQFDKIPTLRPAFDPEGTITAANASKINDGAAALVLASEAACKRHHLQPLARVVASGAHAHEPGWFTTAPAHAMRQALDRAGWKVADVDLFEINEAFANVTMAAIRELELDPSKVNVHGGAIALGHPIGASGARILTTLVHALVARGGRRGLASICIGGGEALAVAVERV